MKNTKAPILLVEFHETFIFMSHSTLRESQIQFDALYPSFHLNLVINIIQQVRNDRAPFLLLSSEEEDNQNSILCSSEDEIPSTRHSRASRSHQNAMSKQRQKRTNTVMFKWFHKRLWGTLYDGLETIKPANAFTIELCRIFIIDWLMNINS